MQNQILIVVLLLIAVVGDIVSARHLTEKPAHLQSCYLTDANFDSCFTANFQTLFTEWRDGVPGLKSVGKLDPLLVKRVKIDQGGSDAIALNADLTNVEVRGTSKGTVREAILDKQTFRLKVKLFIPKLRFDLDYKVKGRVLTFNLNGNGKAFFETDDVQMIFDIITKLRDEGDYTFTDIESVKVSIKDVGGFRMHMDNLFGGQKELEEATNALFNENWREFYVTLRPAVEQTIEAVLLDRFKKTFSYVPANYFVADIPKAANYAG